MTAYQQAVADLSPRALTTHYTDGLQFFHEEFVPGLKQRLEECSGGVWSFDNHLAFAAGSDVDLMTHLVEAVAARERVVLFPGDWHGFRVGCTHHDNIVWDATGAGALACLCVPSVRNGHLTAPMGEFLSAADSCLLNLNLYPTLSPLDRQTVARELAPLLPKSVLSISFSRGFGLTASQLGVILVPKTHPFVKQWESQWNWFTYFFNAIAARAFLAFDLQAAQAVDQERRHWVESWLSDHHLPVVPTGSYYVKSFRVDGELPDYMTPLVREDVVRLCFKPPQA